ncbi:mas-related G-protein coupled receptor member H-like [Pogona vitticeps]
MTNFSLLSLPFLDAGMEYNDILNGSWFSNYSSSISEYDNTFLVGIYITTGFTFLINLAGFVGNGTVIWLLGFHTKRNPFTIYILNLSVADFSILTALAGLNTCWLLGVLPGIYCSDSLHEFFYAFFSFMFSASQFLLTAISIDRCVCLSFPLWHKCHRPAHLSTIICAIIWILTFLISATPTITFLLTNRNYTYLRYYQFLLNAMLFTPVMFLSTLAMIIKVCLMSPQRRRERLLTVILLALILFLLFALPMNFIEYFYFYTSYFDEYLYEYGLICVSLDSTINPLIYFLIGRRKRGRSRGSVKKILEKLFEEGNCAETLEPTVQTEL